jgi:hypothetical protein
VCDSQTPLAWDAVLPHCPTEWIGNTVVSIPYGIFYVLKVDIKYMIIEKWFKGKNK